MYKNSLNGSTQSKHIFIFFDPEWILGLEYGFNLVIGNSQYGKAIQNHKNCIFYWNKMKLLLKLMIK